MLRQITGTKRWRADIDSCAIVKSFRPIDKAILFLQSVYRDHVMLAWRFFSFGKILLL